MDENKVNLLVPEDGLIDDNMEKQYTEELDFSNIQEEIEKVKNETVKPVPLESTYEDAVAEEPIYNNVAPVEQPYDDSVKGEVPLEPSVETNTNYNPGENPSAKVVLNKCEETVTENIRHEDIKVDLKGNKSLWYVLGLGLLLLIVILLLPYVL